MVITMKKFIKITAVILVAFLSSMQFTGIVYGDASI